jgi:metallo-beta-lactamase family protein
MDHSGNLPNLVRQGFAGPIYCTHATRDLIEVMLEDSARIHENEFRGVGDRRGHSGSSLSLFDHDDVQATIDQCVCVEVQMTIDVNPSVRIRFTDSGHILGSAMISIMLDWEGNEHTITFTGDIGRRGVPFHSEPSPVPASDLIICESTYGGKTHDSIAVMASRMAELVKQTIAKGGKVLVPAFSLGRTHLVVHFLRRWMSEGLVPRLPIYIDSPLAEKIDAVYQKYAIDVAPRIESVPCTWLDSDVEVELFSTSQEQCIIVASGGMCEGGRITQHLKYHIDDPRSTIVLVSYQAPHSLGAQLLSRVPTVRFHGQTWNKWIDVAEVKGFSGHAGQEDFEFLMRDAVQTNGRVRLVHGEPPQMLALENQLREMGFSDVRAPKRKESIKL